MPFEKSLDERPAVTSPPCVHLRSKAMYVEGTQRPAESSPCWCNLTQHSRGPDQEFAGVRECVPGRACFRETR